MEHRLGAAAVSFIEPILSPTMHPSDLPAAMQRAFEAQRESYDAAPFADWPTRRDRLQRLQRLVAANEREIEAAIDADFGGRPRMETQRLKPYRSVN